MPRSARATRAAPAAAKTSTAAPANRATANRSAAAPTRPPTGKRPAAKTASTPVSTLTADSAATLAPAPAAAPTTAPAAAPAPTPTPQPTPKRKKPKLVRDGFTMPEADYALLAALKKRALQAGREVKKSELLRAGLRALAAMPEAAYLGALEGVERIKPGRPAAD